MRLGATLVKSETTEALEVTRSTNLRNTHDTVEDEKTSWNNTNSQRRLRLGQSKRLLLAISYFNLVDLDKALGVLAKGPLL